MDLEGRMITLKTHKMMVQGDKEDEWYPAKDWQEKNYIAKVKNAQYVYPNQEIWGEEFKNEHFKYKFMMNSPESLYLVNMNTGKRRMVHFMPKHLGANSL